MAKLTAEQIANKVKALYKPKDSGREIITTGAALKRPTKPEDFVLAPKDHVWTQLTGLLGLPYDMIIQVAGAPDSGKSSIAGEFMASAQKQGVYVILWDCELKFDALRFDKHFGGKHEELNIIATTIIRKGAGAALKYINTIKEADPKAKILLVWDSVGASVSRARAEHAMDDDKNAQIASEAVENSEFMRHLVATFDKYQHSIAVLLINQTTMRIGIIPGRDRAGGSKISFHSSMIIELNRIQDLTKTVKGVRMKEGIITRSKVCKNHLSQTDLSVHEMRIKVTAKGWQAVDGVEPEESEE